MNSEEKDTIKALGASTEDTNGERIHCISIIGQIEGHYALPEGQKATKYEHIVPMLVSVEQSEDKELFLLLPVRMKD